jgi:hypothetical protein
MKVNTQIVMVASAVFMGTAGIAASFLPHEILNSIGVDATGVAPLIVQTMGALYLGYAIMNWMSKGIIIGGIYARPLALGNFTHFAVGALALIKGASHIEEMRILWAATAIYIVFAVLFGYILFSHPLDSKSSSS